MAGRSKARIKGGGSGGGLMSLLSQFFGGNVGINPDAIDAQTLAKGGVLEGNPGETMISADRYKALQQPDAQNLFKANNWLSKPTANQLNQQFGLSRALSEGGVQDALTQAKGMIPITAEGNQITKDQELAYQKVYQKLLTDQRVQEAFLTALAGGKIDATDPAIVAMFKNRTTEPLIEQAASEAGAKGKQAKLAGQQLDREISMDLENDPEQRTVSRNQALIAAEASRVGLQNIPEVATAEALSKIQAPANARMAAERGEYSFIPPGYSLFNTRFGYNYGPTAQKPNFLADAFANGGAALTNKPANTLPTGLVSPPVIPNAAGMGNYVRDKDGNIIDLRTGQKHKLVPVVGE